jgi:hypothetical protein
MGNEWARVSSSTCRVANIFDRTAQHAARLSPTADNCIPIQSPCAHCSPLSPYYLVLHYMRLYVCPHVAADWPIRWLCRPSLSSSYSLCPHTCPPCGAGTTIMCNYHAFLLESCTVFNMLWAPLPTCRQVTRFFLKAENSRYLSGTPAPTFAIHGTLGFFSAHRHPLSPFTARSMSSRHTGTLFAHTRHARYLLGTPAPSIAIHDTAIHGTKRPTSWCWLPKTFATNTLATNSLDFNPYLPHGGPRR